MFPEIPAFSPGDPAPGPAYPGSSGAGGVAEGGVSTDEGCVSAMKRSLSDGTFSDDVTMNEGSNKRVCTVDDNQRATDYQGSAGSMTCLFNALTKPRLRPQSTGAWPKKKLQFPSWVHGQNTIGKGWGGGKITCSIGAKCIIYYDGRINIHDPSVYASGGLFEGRVLLVVTLKVCVQSL